MNLQKRNYNVCWQRNTTNNWKRHKTRMVDIRNRWPKQCQFNLRFNKS